MHPLSIFFFPFFGFGFLMYFLPSIIAVRPQQAGHDGNPAVEYLPGVVGDGLGGRAGLGGEDRLARGGEVSSTSL
jgi:hypothetical protein